MKRTKSKMVEAAIVLHEQLLGKPPHSEAVYLPTYGWDSIQKLQRQIRMARARGWHAALKRLHDDLANELFDFRRQLDMPLQQLQPTSRVPCRKASVTDTYRDLWPSSRSSRNTSSTWTRRNFPFTTDAMELEETYLGLLKSGLSGASKEIAPWNIESSPSIRIRPRRTKASRIPTSKMNVSAKAKAVRLLPQRWPNAGSTTSLFSLPRCFAPTAAAALSSSWTTGRATLVPSAATTSTRKIAFRASGATRCSATAALLLQGLR